MSAILRHPSAWVPIAGSLIVLMVMLAGMGIFGVPTRQADEGVAAHLFQLWLLLEALAVTSFGVRWLPQAPKQALLILTLQVGAALTPMAVVYSLHL